MLEKGKIVMSVSASGPLHHALATHPPIPVLANARDETDYNLAKRHSRHVRILKRVLPMCAVLIALLFVLSAGLSFSPISEVSIDKAELRQGKLVMERPKMAGFDKNNRPYDVKAQKAIQDLTKPGTVELEVIDARLPMDTSSYADLDAQSGVYDTSTEKLLLRDTVSIKGARGMDFLLKDADIDIRTGSMQSDKPVKVTSPNTQISAESIKVEDNGRRILFKDRVKMTIIRPVERGNTPSSN